MKQGHLVGILFAAASVFFGKQVYAETDPNDFLKSSEIIAETHKEYVAFSEATSALVLKPNSNVRFSCTVFSVGQAGALDSILEFTTEVDKGGSIITLRTTDAAKDTAERFIMNRFSDGIRGEAVTFSKTREITAAQLINRNLSNDLLRESYWTKVADYQPPLKAVRLMSKNTLGIAQNRENPDELFIELGIHSTVEAIDVDNNSVSKGDFAVVSRVPGLETRDRRHPLDRLDVLKQTFLPQFKGNRSLPASYAFRKWAKNGVAENGDWYRMTGIGRCHEIEAQSDALENK